MRRLLGQSLACFVAIVLMPGCSDRSPTEPNEIVRAEVSLLTTAANRQTGLSIYRHDHTQSLVRRFQSACGLPSAGGALDLPRGAYIVVLDILPCDDTTFATVPVAGFVDVGGRRIFSATATAPFVAHRGGDVLVTFDVR